MRAIVIVSQPKKATNLTFPYPLAAAHEPVWFHWKASNKQEFHAWEGLFTEFTD